MRSDFELRLRSYAEIIVRVGLNLQPGQNLLIAEPYELHGIAPDSAPLVEAVKSMLSRNGLLSQNSIEIIWGNADRLRDFAAHKDWRGLSRLAAANAGKMNGCIKRGDALLFLLGSHPNLMAGLPSLQVAEARRIGAEHFGAVAQQLMRGATNWTAAPAPTLAWADVVHASLPADDLIPALWNTIFEAMRIEPSLASAGRDEKTSEDRDHLTAWETHLKALKKFRDELNSQCFTTLNYKGDGTDLTVDLPHEHQWCTAGMRSDAGVDFVANLPTEEVFTVPHRESARGVVRVACPIAWGGGVIDGIELEFKHGRVINAEAKTGGALLRRLLETDPGAGRLGEVALVGSEIDGLDFAGNKGLPQWMNHRPFHHVLLDENAGSHIALGEGYGFCLKSSNFGALNRSMIHVDLPVAAKAHLRR